MLNKIKTPIPQYTTDPSSPEQEEAWVLRSGGSGAIGAPLHMGVTQLSAGGAGFTYQFSYRTKENTTKRVTIS